MSKKTTLTRLDKLLEESYRIRLQDSSCSEVFQEWCKSVLSVIEGGFGRESDYLRQFKNIQFEETFFEGLEDAKSIIKEMKNEIIDPLFKKQRYRFWKNILAVVVIGIITGLAPEGTRRLLPKEKAPRFFLRDPHIHPRDSLIIVAENRAAMKYKPLTVVFDNVKFLERGELLPNTQPPQWYFSLSEPQVPSKFLVDGTHTIRVGFTGEPLSEELNVYFNRNLAYADTIIPRTSSASVETGSTSEPLVNQVAEEDTLIFGHVQESFYIGSRIAMSRDRFFEASGEVNSPCQGGRHWFCFVSNGLVWPKDYLRRTDRSFKKRFAVPDRFRNGRIVLACLPQRLHDKYYDWVFGQVMPIDQPLMRPEASEFEIVMESILLILD